MPPWALNANIVNKPEDLTAKDLGHAEVVEEDNDTDITRIFGCKNPKAITILIRGTSDYLLDELERAVVDGTRVVMDAIEDGTYVVGGGAVETESLMKIRDYAETVGGRVQLAIEGYAKAFETIPRILLQRTPGTIRLQQAGSAQERPCKGQEDCRSQRL